MISSITRKFRIGCYAQNICRCRRHSIIFPVAAHSQVRVLPSAPSDAKQKPTEVPKVVTAGPDTTTDTYGDWAVICAAPPSGSSERSCEVDTTLTIRGQTAPFARIAILRQAKDKPVRIIALVPVNVSIASGIKIESDPGKSEINLLFKSCVPTACVAEAELSKDALQAFRAQTRDGQLTIIDASGKPAKLQFSLRGLDQALEAYFKRQEK